MQFQMWNGRHCWILRERLSNLILIHSDCQIQLYITEGFEKDQANISLPNRSMLVLRRQPQGISLQLEEYFSAH